MGHMSEPLDLKRLRTCRLADRPSLVSADQFGRVAPPGAAFGEWLDSLPSVLAGQRVRAVRDAICDAHRHGRHVVAAMGAHVVKVGCSPYVIDWIRRGIVTAVAVNGAFAVHDVEVALVGKTSEDVGTRLADGSFGTAAETADAYGAAARQAVDQGVGLGRALGQHLLESRGAHVELSVLAAAADKDIPCTVHVAVGTDVVHMHPCVSGAALGEASMTDFRLLAGVVAELDDGVFMNIGSAVVLPEVFLKCVSVARNLGHGVERVTSVNLDMIQHYRPQQNVLGRPAWRGLALTGHHEIMVPLLHAAVNARLASQEEV